MPKRKARPELDTQVIEVNMTADERAALKMHQAGAGPAQIARELFQNRITRQAAYDTVKRAERKQWRIQSRERYAANPGDCPVEECPLTSRVRHGLIAAGYNTLGKLAGMTRMELRAIDGVGRHAAFQIFGLLKSRNVPEAKSFCPKCGKARTHGIGDTPKKCSSCGYETSVTITARPAEVEQRASA